MEQLEAARAALAAGRGLAALDGLLEAWRQSRSAPLADAIDALTAVLGRSLPPISEKKPKVFHERWVDLANAQRACDAGRLLQSWAAPPWSHVRERVDRLVQRPDDPRIGLALARFVRDLPTAYSAGDATWRAIFKLLIRIGDVRCAGPLEVRSALGADVQLGQRISKVLASLAKVQPQPIDGALIDGLHRLIAQLSELPSPSEAQLLSSPVVKAGEGPTEDELLRRIYEQPTDDGARLVYADFLSERGDPRGELIALQFKGKPNAKEHKRIRALLKEHTRAWLGEVEPAVVAKTETFARGFLNACRLDFRTPAQRAQLGTHPAWNTLTKLWIYEDRDAQFLLANPLKGLEELGGTLGVDLGARMAQRTLPYPRLQMLRINITDAPLEHLEAITAAAAFPSLVAIGISGSGHQAEQRRALESFDWLFDSVLGRRMELLEISYLQVDLRQWLTRLSAHPALERFEVAAWPPISFWRDAGAWRARVRAVYRADTEALAVLEPLAAAGLVRTVEVGPVQAGEAKAREKLQRGLSGIELIEVPA